MWRNITTSYIHIYKYITRLASKEIFSPLKKNRDVGRAKYLSAALHSEHCSSVPDLLKAYAVPVNLLYFPELYPTSYIRKLPRYPRHTFYTNSVRTLYPTLSYTRCLNRRFFFLLRAVSVLSENLIQNIMCNECK